ncbi:cytochrome c oxidase assembly factor 6 homolog [Trichomycterus rosablanca]|uniref:cytochrome c oxidase assembly factor 6 homolog n=1 Tax=Trichomycterus rosablanca TaxID=2290929 RepID=UPI002F3557B5
MAAPNSNQRRACWEARNRFWCCLDHSGDNVVICKKFQEEFESKCPPQWVKYFSKRRDFLKFKEKIENEGFESAEGASKF